MPSKDLTARRNPAIAGCTATGVLKILALVFMFIDHAGKMLFPQIAEMRMLGRIARIAVPSILQQSFISVGNLFIQSLVNGFGSAVVAGYSAAVKLNTFALTCFTLSLIHT